MRNRPSRYRHPISRISLFGITYSSTPRPAMVAWWSAAFPGFGHFIINQYARGTLLTLTEIGINSMCRLNEAIVFTFCGRFDDARHVLNMDWAFGYAIVFLFAIWDSYRSALYQSSLRDLAKHERQPIGRMLIHPLEVQYIERKKPLTGFFYSILFPGLGQLYNQRFCLAFYLMFWWWIFIGTSHAFAACVELLYGSVPKSTVMLSPHWFMFMPSVVGGAAYHAYRGTIEQNKLFREEQLAYLRNKYGQSKLDIFAESG